MHALPLGAVGSVEGPAIVLEELTVQCEPTAYISSLKEETPVSQNHGGAMHEFRMGQRSACMFLLHFLERESNFHQNLFIERAANN